MKSTLEIAQDLIRRESVTPDDANCTVIVAESLLPYGFVAEWLDFGETRNLWLRRGNEPPLLAFLGHTDVVPPGPLEQWKYPPFAAEVHEGVLYGRGAADMKGGIAAFITAAQRFVEAHPEHPGSIALLLTSDEEGDASDGVVKVIEAFAERSIKIDWCLIGEPSCCRALGDVVRIGRRGSLSARLRVLGEQGHVAYPERADNPIHRVAPALAELVGVEWDKGNDYFPPTTFQISNIRGGTGAENVIPGHLDIACNWRFSTESTAEGLQSRFVSVLARYGIRCEVGWHLSGNPFLTKGETLLSAVQAAIEAVTGVTARADTGGGTSDGRFVAPTGAECVELGPLNASIHKVDEHVAVAELEQLARIYERVLIRLLGPQA